ncbi:phosphate regulon sensor histidine kinase PhoR [Fontimonas sp. SYSU GA230001]|uniref:phosphate regulon sensor histidine kinase PhoR n=1 Tax=Fontimonas sp. SYSU GA230001 TaxID=3142450 RepID=UPI0032B4CF85
MSDRPQRAVQPVGMAAAPPPAPVLESRAYYWRRELIHLAGWAMLGGGLGWLADRPAGGLAVTFGLYALAHTRRLIQLRVWLQRPKSLHLPDAGRLWGEVFDGLHDLQRKNRKKKKKLAAMLAEFQASTAALPDGAVVLTPSGEISWFNSAARTLLGLRPHQDYGIRIANLIRHPTFSEYLEKGDFGGEVEVPSPVNRGKTLALRIIPYGREQKLLIARDVSERQLLDAARRDFVSNASHELRTPLTVLRGYLDMMEQDAQGNGVLKPWAAPIGEMRSQALRMESLVSDMLKLARLEAGRTQMRDHAINAPALIRRAVEDARQLSKGQHRFEVQIDERLQLTGGETEFQSIVGNLLSNAVRYTAPGGVIRVSWAERPGEGVCLSVADSGIGIAPADIPRITERFYRVDVGRSRASGGTGLGLSIVKHALEAFDSELQIDSELGVGSTFSCVFPVHRMNRSAEVATASDESRHK